MDDDKVIDENLLKIRPSLTLEETNVINSKVNFEDFEVDGILTVLQNFNGTNFEKQLNSVIYKATSFRTIFLQFLKSVLYCRMIQLQK